MDGVGLNRRCGNLDTLMLIRPQSPEPPARMLPLLQDL
jgi:hypothetical protein